MAEILLKLDDERLIQLYSEGNEAACDILLERYKNLVKKKARAMYIAGGDSDDLIQEGMIGLYKAIRDYDPNKMASFMTFASMCINRQMCTAVSMANRKKHNPLNTYMSFYTPLEGEEEEDATLSDVLISESDGNPENIYIDRESFKDLEGRLNSTLSELELMVLKYFMLGEGYVEIAARLGKSPKSIDNALQRIKSKCQNLISKNKLY